MRRSIFSFVSSAAALTSCASAAIAQLDCRLGPGKNLYAQGWFRQQNSEESPLLGNVFAVHARPINSCDEQSANPGCPASWSKIEDAARLQNILPEDRPGMQPWLVEFATAAHVIVEVCGKIEAKSGVKVDLRIIQSPVNPKDTVSIPIDESWCKQHNQQAVARLNASLQQGAALSRDNCDQEAWPSGSDLYLFAQVVIIRSRYAVVPFAIAPLPSVGERDGSTGLKVPGFRPFSSPQEIRRRIDGIWFAPGSFSAKYELQCAQPLYEIGDQPAPYGSSGSPVLLQGSAREVGAVGIVVQEGTKTLAQTRAEAKSVFPAFVAAGDPLSQAETGAATGKEDPRIVAYISQGLSARSARFIPLMRRPSELLQAMQSYDVKLAELSGVRLPPTYYTMSFLWNQFLEFASNPQTKDERELLSDAARYMTPLERVALLDQAFRKREEYLRGHGTSEDVIDSFANTFPDRVLCYKQLEPAPPIMPRK